MKNWIVERSIAAPVRLVFETVSDVRNFRQAIPHIITIEFLTEQHHGQGTRFRETRLMHGREATCELEVVEFVPDHRVRMVSDEGGTVWDTVFTVSPFDDQVLMRMEMEARPHTLLARITTPLIRGMISKAVEADMDAVKAYCEAQAAEITMKDRQ